MIQSPGDHDLAHGAPSSEDDTEAFTAQVREFLRTHLPDELRQVGRANVLPRREHIAQWQRILNDHGWGAPGWPVEFGGTGWNLTRQAIFLHESALADAPRGDNLGLATIGPAIIKHGTAAQQQRFLPRIRSFDDYWAQGFSEPGAGSDLASLATTARRDGDHYIVNGTKIWTSHAHWSDWALVLVRTDSDGARRQDGISVLLVDLRTPGVTVRPIRFINGSTFHCEVFFDDVRVPADCLLGEPGGGWRVARDMLVQERLFLARVPECARDLARLAQLGSRPALHGGTLGDEPWFARKLAVLGMRFEGYESAWWHAVERAQQGHDVDVDASVLRLMGTAMLQDINAQQLEAVGEAGLCVDQEAIDGIIAEDPLDGDRAGNIHLHHLRYRGITLGAGTAEIQRGIVARALQSTGKVPLPPPPPAMQPFAEAARRVASSHYDFEHRRRTVGADGFDDGAWRTLADLGLFGALVPESRGGIGLTPDALAYMAIELGESLIVEPWYWSSAAAGALARHETGADTLHDIVQGRSKIAFACSARGMRTDPYAYRASAAPAASGWTVDAQAAPVWGGMHCDEIWLPVRLDAHSNGILRVDPSAASVQLRALRTYDGRAGCLLELSAHAFTCVDLVAIGPVADAIVRDVLDYATLCEAAEATGAMRRALEITIDYLATRRQFGRALGDFQVLQHRLADHYVRLYQLHAFVVAAANAVTANTLDRGARLMAAKWAAATFGREVGHDVLQLHGAIGLQDETPICHFAKRMLAGGAMLGDAEIQISRYIAAWRDGLTSSSPHAQSTMSDASRLRNAAV